MAPREIPGSTVRGIFGTRKARAVWKAELPRPGRYNVYARWVMTKPTDRASNAPFTVRHAEGGTTVRVDLSQFQSAAEYPAGKAQSPWNLLGTFAFERAGEVVLGNDADNSVVADAIRFEYMEALDAPEPRRGRLLFRDDLETMEGWFVEGSEGSAEIADGALRVRSTSHKNGIHAWFRSDLPDSVMIEYDMTVHGPEGSALVFFAALGSEGEDILTALPTRDGVFGDYVRNPRMRSYHLSIHRRGPRAWVQGANLNRSPGKTLIQRNPVDPCPPMAGEQTYHITLIKMGRRIELAVDDRPVLFCLDEEGEPYGGGKFGFRQIYRSTIRYDNLKIHEAVVPGP